MRKCDIIVERILYHNESSGYAVFTGVILRWSKQKSQFIPTKETHTFVGYLFCLFLGDRFETEVDEVFNKTHGSQYLISYSKRAEPASLAEIKTFFLKNVKGMTVKRADQLMDMYGASAIQAVCNDPTALNFMGLSPTATDSLRDAVRENATFEETMAHLMLQGIDCRYAMALHQKYKESAVLTMKNNPYQIYMDKIFDFKTADRLYLTSGKLPSSPKRCLYTTLATLQMDSEKNGNIFTRKDRLKEKMRSFLTDTNNKGNAEDYFPFSDIALENSVAELQNIGSVICDEAFGEPALYTQENYYDERKVSQCLLGLMTDPKRICYAKPDIESFVQNYEKITGLHLAPAQSEAVLTALTSPITIISGGPGTGKTQTINSIMAAVRALAPEAVIRACAPTGKAAIRITELTNVKATTIHRALGMGNYKGLLHGGELICDVMFVDEVSMADIHLFAKLFDAMNTCGRVILVGDYNQLPSVGPGLVLRDFIASGVIPKVILNQVFRQAGASRIITNSHRIINQVPGQKINLRIANAPWEDFYFIEESDPQKIINTVLRTVDKLRTVYKYGVDAVQVLSPVHFGDVGVERLNQVLQEHLNSNPISFEFGDKEFRVGDKVTHIQNNYELGVFNGEVGIVTDIDYVKERAIKVAYPDRDIWYPIVSVCELELAYAMTVHKMQGSEYPVIILPVHEFQGRGLSKNLIYTALTRARKMVIIIGSKSALANGLRRETTIERESNLVGRLQSILPTLSLTTPATTVGAVS